MLAKGESVGLIFGLLMADGKIEIGATGTLHDNPLLASGLASDISATFDGWRDHPANYIPDDD